MINNIKRCVIYARVSTEEQTEKFGLSSQISELRSYASKVGYSIAHEFVDDYSGGDLGRPALTALRELVRNHSVSVVLIHDPDRLARKLAHQLILTEEFERAGVRLEFVTTPSTDTMEGRLLLNVRGVIAEYEREKIRERTMRGRREKARQGLVVGGKRPYGYAYQNRLYVVNESEASVIANIFRWLVEDSLSIRQIIEKLNENGYKPHTSSRWAKSTVSRILRNDLYIGKNYYNRRERVAPEIPVAENRRNKKTRQKWRAQSEWIEQSVPPIISAELFLAAQVKLKQNSQHCSGRPSKTVYLLRGILKCCVCGRKYYGVPIFQDKYYRCVGHERLARPYCPAPVIAAKTIETFVWDYIVRLLMNPDLLAAKLAEQGSDDKALSKELHELERQIQELRRKEDRLLEALLDGDVPLPGMRTKAKELAYRRLALQRAYDHVQGQLALRLDQTRIRETAMRYCQLLGGSLPQLDLPARQKLLRALLDEVVVEGSSVTLKGILPISLEFGNRPQRVDDRAAGLGQDDVS